MTDTELLHLFITEDSNAAFTQLTTRHAGLVYTAALRQTRSTALASDITQAVFLDLARHARKLRPDTHLPSWLITVTRRTAIDAIRRESRLRTREQTSAELATVNAHDSPNASTSDLAPILDDALTALPEPDRRAVLLRFFENQSFQQIARHIDATETTTQKRVTRALEKLRTQLARRGITTTATLLAAQLPLHASTTIPVTLATTLATPAFLATAATLTTTAATFTQTLIMTATQKTVLVSALVLAVTGLIVEGVFIAKQNREIASYRHEHASHQLQLALLRDQLRTAESASTPATAPAAADPTEERIRSLVARIKRLKGVVAIMPDEQIFEMRYLTENDWLRVVMTRDLEDPDAVMAALAELRSAAKSSFARALQVALNEYVGVHDGKLPASATELASFFTPPIDPATLTRYDMRVTGTVDRLGDKDIILAERPSETPRVPYETFIEVGLRQTTSQMIRQKRPSTPPAGLRTLPNHLQFASMDAHRAYAAAHNGDEPPNIFALRPYFKNPEHAEQVLRFMKGHPIDPKSK
jgi:RNA polymerase sigma factor (sigma-70 family)